MKPKILEISSEEYPHGRIDKFVIEMQENLQSPIIDLFKELGCPKEELNDLDLDYPSTRGYFFVYSKKIKAHFFVGRGDVILVLDSNFKKEKLIFIIEKYFQIF